MRPPQPEVDRQASVYTSEQESPTRGQWTGFDDVQVKEENQADSDGSMVFRTDARREMVAPDSWGRGLYGKSL